jgi:fatty-acyl-CoA synthase
LLASAATMVLTDEDLLPIVSRAQVAAGLAREPLTIPRGDGEPTMRRGPRADTALLQFTSGSSGRPRGVEVTWDNLETNIQTCRDWVHWGPEEAGAHWLPLYHDMGLIACFLAPIINQRDHWVMRPDQFIRDPMRWLERFGSGATTLTAGPNFCFAYAARHLRPEQLEGMDFSAWRVAVVGAERLDPAALGKFADALAPYGFRREVFLPAYGLAEATLAVTVGRPGTVARVVRPDWSTVAFGRPVTIAEEAELGDAGIGDGSGRLVGCGEPLPGVELTVIDEDGRPLADGCLGELAVGGPTVAAGYAGDARSTSTRLADGFLRTGDAGFLFAGEVFVTGRLGDALKLRGVTLYAEDIEAKLTAIEGVPKGRCVVVPGLAEGVDSVAVIVEAKPGEWVAEARRLLARETGGAKVTIFLGAPGSIERTSSGKLRRRVIWRALIDGELGLEPAVELESTP